MTIIQKIDGTLYDLSALSMRTRDVLIASPTPKHNMEELEGANGLIDYGTTHGPRDITVIYRMTAIDNVDFSLLRDEIFDLFRSDEPFYFIEKRNPGKRWLVKVKDSYLIPQMLVYGDFDINLIGFKGLSESVFTSTEIEANGLNYDADLYAYGVGLSYEDEKTIYSGTVAPSKTLRIFNPGNEAIHAFDAKSIHDTPLKFTIKSVQGGASGFKLKNSTNGTSITFNGAVAESDTVIYDGAIISRNSLQATNQAELDYITLARGWNEIKLERGQSAHIAIDTRFYYL